MNDLTASGIVGYLVALAVVVFDVFVLGNPKYRWAIRLDSWCYKNVPAWLGRVHGWVLNIAAAIATAPIWLGSAWILTRLSQIAWFAAVPIFFQVLIPPVLVLFLWVEVRGVICRLDVPKRVVVFIIVFMTFATQDSGHPHWPIWMYSFWAAMYWCTIAGLLFGTLIHGRQLGFWPTFLRFFDMTARLYGPGHPLEPLKWHGWNRPFGYEDESKSDVFGNAHVATVDEMKKGGLL